MFPPDFIQKVFISNKFVEKNFFAEKLSILRSILEVMI